jgi:hypothetical protein
MQSHAAEGRKLLMSNPQLLHPQSAFSHKTSMVRVTPRSGCQQNPTCFKIIAVADGYDAINSDRVYSKGKSKPCVSMSSFFRVVNSHFDEIVVNFTHDWYLPR